MSFPGFAEFHITVESSIPVTIFGLHRANPSSNQPPILLVHGYPQSHHIWHKVAPELAKTHSVVAIDLRGYGQSSKPSDKDDVSHSLYSKRSMANDCVQVMNSLGYKKFYYIGHDRGARVGHRLCVNYSDNVVKAIFLDIAPTLAMYKSTDQTFASLYYHWFFLIQPSPFPETFITSNPKVFIENCLGGFGRVKSLGHFEHAHIAEYVNALGSFEGAHSTCEDYRAAATIDLEHDQKDVDEGRKMTVPLAVLWGKRGVIQRCFDTLALWRNVAVDVRGEMVDSGHYIPEEVPNDLLRVIGEFFA